MALSYMATGNYNTAIGRVALCRQPSGDGSVAVGNQSQMYYIGGTSYNTAVGTNSLRYNELATYCTAIGYNALNSQQKSTNTRNVAVGGSAMQEFYSGSYNTAVGHAALYGGTVALPLTGTGNTAMGYAAMDVLSAGDNNTAVGRDAFNIATNFSNAGAFGYNAQPAGSNQIRLGNTAVTNVVSQVGNWSDERDKADIRDTILGLDFVCSLRPVDYKWDYREDYRPQRPKEVSKPEEISEFSNEEEKAEYAIKLEAYEKYRLDLQNWQNQCKLSNLVHDGTHKRTRYHHGLIAQEVKAVIEKTGVDFGGFQDCTVKDGDDAMLIAYTELLGPMIKAIQELKNKNEALESRLAKFENGI